MGHYHTSWSDTPVWLRCVCLGSCGFLCGFMGWTVYHENKEMKKTISTEIGVEIKSLDSIQLSKDDRVDNNKKYYVTLSGKLKETVNNSNQWKVTYKLSEIDYSYLLNKCDGNESTIE